MAINRYELVTRHNPVLRKIEYKSPMSVGNGEFAFTCDVTGLQTLYDEYLENLSPLCTMSQWGWHISPVSPDKYAYTTEDLEFTEYDYADRNVSYAVEQKPGNEEVYYWLRKNPHKFNLGRLGFLYNREPIKSGDISDIKQTLNLYEGVLESNFKLHQVDCKVRTCCHFDTDAISIEVESQLLTQGALSVQLIFPYASPDVSASDWESNKSHKSKLRYCGDNKLIIERIIDKTMYYSCLRMNEGAIFYQNFEHDFRVEQINNNKLSLSLTYYSSENVNIDDNDDFSTFEKIFYVPTNKQVLDSSINGWKSFWETTGVVDLHKSKDKRALELERRIILSLYQSRINCLGSMPPQETGLVCNSWHGKFHLEMYLWHQAYVPLWNHTKLMEPSLNWYLKILPEAKTNATRNRFKGAKWPKQVAYDGVDSPSPIATLLIWQQPHIIYMLELAYQSEKDKLDKAKTNKTKNKSDILLERYYILVKETADYMVDLAVYNKESGKYELLPPVIPAQEAHDPKITLNPVFEVEYWRFTLLLAYDIAKRLNREDEAKEWLNVANNMADLPLKDGLYLAHENCPTTYEEFNKDHPMMTAIYGLIPSDRVEYDIMEESLKKILECWDLDTTWGWDFAMMAMTATRLGKPELAIELLLMDTPNNHYVISGHNAQTKREDLPVYLPGNGSLLLAVAMMTAGFSGCDSDLPGFPKDGSFIVEYENIKPFPY